MIYKFRLKLSLMLLRWGRDIHPDIAKLVAEIKERQLEMGRTRLILGVDE